MRFTLPISLLAVPAVHAAVGGRCTPAGGANSRSICISTSVCRSYGGTYVNNRCPDDPADIKCCSVDNCLDNSSFCTWTGANNECEGIPQAVFVSGYCPGGSNYKCCNYGA
ncbi:hypothetical protein B0O99DRAFT_395236 [Bisporella sp. PMI_857]|nr:hypothetical protein B0O99DRAFT_395236 [Bisporella sp. PMI_857]